MARMPVHLEREERANAVTAAVNHLLVTEGAWALSMRSIGHAARRSPSTLLHQFDSREHLLRVCALRTGKERMQRIEFWSPHSRAAAFLPGTDADLVLERAWQQWLILARGVDWLTSTIDRLREAELAVLAAALRRERDDEQVTACRALLDGLCLAVCDPSRPLGKEAARDVLDAHLPRLLAEPQGA